MFFSIFLLTFLTSGQQTLTSQEMCEQAVEAKAQILNTVKSECQWELPAPGESNPEGCSRYEDVNGEQVERTSTYLQSGHHGHLVCGSTLREQESSYQNRIPQFKYFCARCSTSDRNNQLDDNCLRSMRESELAYCRSGGAKMQYQYAPGRAPTPASRGSAQ